MRTPSRSTGTARPTPAEPVTVTAARTVPPERREEFEQWATQVQALAATFPGYRYLGSTTLHPGPGGQEYHLVYRFADAASLARWEHSPERAAQLERAHELSRDEQFARVEGLHGFFARPPRHGPAWRVVLPTVLGVYLLSSVFHLVAEPWVRDRPWPARLLLSAVVVVNGLRFVVMPVLTHWTAGWLHPAPRRRRR